MRVEDASDRIPAVKEWASASVDDGRVRLSLGDELTPKGAEEYFVTLSPEGAMALAVELLEKGYIAMGEDVHKILILLNPELDDEEEEKPEEMPS